MRQIRAVSLLGYEDVAASVGLDGAILLRRVGISKEALGDPENRIPAIAVAELLEISATLSGREDFGLLTTRRRQFAHLGPVSMLLAHLPNLREMVKVSIDYQRHFNDIVDLSLEEDGDGCLIKLALDPGFGRDQVVDQTIGVAHRVLLGASGGGWRPECVHPTRRPPSRCATLAAVLRCSDRFRGELQRLFLHARGAAGRQSTGRCDNGPPRAPPAGPGAGRCRADPAQSKDEALYRHPASLRTRHASNRSPRKWP